MSQYTANLEKCDICFRLVSIEKQTRGVCHACADQLSITSCSKCGELFRSDQLDDQDFMCPACFLGYSPKFRMEQKDDRIYARVIRLNRGKPTKRNPDCPCCGPNTPAADRDHCPLCDKPDKDFGEIVAELINHGLSDREIFDQLVQGYGYDSVVEDLVAHIRVIKSRLFLDPFPDGDLVSYLEMARICLEHYRKTDIGPQMDLSDEEMVRLAIQLEDYLDGR